MTGLSSCARKKKVSKKDETATVSEKKSDYNIGIALSYENSDYVNTYNAEMLGFKAALSENAGEDAISYEVNSDPIHDDIDLVYDQYLMDKDLIFAIGDTSLKAGVAKTEEVPIVATGVIDFYDALGLHSADRYIWSRKSNRNVTGVSTLPALAEQLSVMIEVTPEIDTVGLFYVAGNMEEIYQNTLMEKYLKEAGINWMEYPINPEPESPEQELSFITAKAVSECSILFLPAGEGLKPYAPYITSIAENNAKYTFGGDEVVGQYTTISTFEDPYQKGYKAGEMAYKILYKNKEPGEMKVGLSNGSINKLYNKPVLDAMGVSLPKSFKEFSEFFESYTPGE